MIRFFIVLLSTFSAALLHAQGTFPGGSWQASLTREDGQVIPFVFEARDSAGKSVWLVENAEERLLVDSIIVFKDSVLVQMPFFDSYIRARLGQGNQLTGEWVKRLEKSEAAMPFSAVRGPGERFPTGTPTPGLNISGRWAVDFVNTSTHDTTRSVGEFIQNGNKVTGTFLNPTGDYRYLEGIINGDTLKLSCFDGGHAFLFSALIRNNQLMTGGKFYSGIRYSEEWSAKKDPTAALETEYGTTRMKNGSRGINFSFPSIDGEMVSNTDKRFQNKVVLVQIMGSWCPNCMDETAFLSEYYNRNKHKGLEIVSLAYERSTDFERSKNAIRAFQRRFKVKYPMLVTGVTVADPARTEKTLPQLEKINAFPTLIIIDKKGVVRKIHSGFSGPGTGIHYEHFKDDFDKIIGDLLGE
jgi:thiol-disulfide isomerase/thioredoxin